MKSVEPGDKGPLARVVPGTAGERMFQAVCSR